MTACANNNEGKAFSGKKAVSATLAGVLAVGMVPAAALADEAPADGADEAGIDLLVADKAFEKATVVAVTDNAGVTTEIEEGDDIELAFTGGPHYIQSVKLQLADGNDTEITVSNGNEYQFTYKKDSSEITANQVQAADEYTLEIKSLAEDEYKNQVKTIGFSIVVEETEADVELKMATAVDDGDVAATSSDIVFNNMTKADLFDGSAEIGGLFLYVDGSETSITKSAVYKANDTSAAGAIKDGDVLYAGDYVAVLNYGSGKTATVKFAVAPLDLSTATVTANATANKNIITGAKGKINYTVAGANEDVKNALKTAYSLDKNDGVPQASITDKGEYTFTLSVKDGASNDLKASVTGTKDFGVKYVDTVATIKYDGGEFSSASGDYTIGGDGMFSAKEVEFWTSATATTPLDKDICNVTVYNSDGEAVTDWATTPGSYTAVATVNDKTFKFGGTASASFTVSYGEVATDGVYVSYNGKLAGNSIAKTYDGENAIEDITVKVVNDKQTMVEGKDYELVYTNSSNKEVTEIVDADTYTLTVKPLTFSFDDSNNTATITVNAIKPTATRVANEVTVDGATGLAYTGEAINPVIEYTTETLVGNDVPEDAEWTVLPAETYSTAIKYQKKAGDTAKYVDEVKEVGTYTIELTLNVSEKNYDLTGSGVASVNFDVIDAKRFLDVPANAWYAEFVDEAYTQNYMSGYAGTKFFGPEDSIKRGDVCIVLARMAGVKLGLDENEGSDIGYYETPFSDVDGHYYYAEAIAWAAKTGIVTGDEGLGTFRPEDTVTREEFATMLMRYAQKAGTDVSADAAAELGKYSDGDQVSDWAKAAVAWASSDEIMTGHADSGLMDPAGDVTRAQVAKMIVTYQPKSLVTSTVAQ